MGIIRIRRPRDSRGRDRLTADPTAAYIAELRRLLRTNSRTRRRIVREIEDHLYDSSLANDNPSSGNSVEDHFGSAARLAEEFNALANEGRRRFLGKVAVICVASAAAFTLMAPSNLAVSPHGNLPLSASNFVTVDPSTGSVLLTHDNLVHINPMTGTVLPAVALRERSTSMTFRN